MNNREQPDGKAEGGPHRSGAGSALTSGLLAGLLLVACLSHCPLWAQTNAVKATSSSRRWLLVVETSKTMQGRMDAMLGTVQELLLSDLDGQLQAGDTLGVWTFNEDLYAGLLPLQRWSPQTRKDITLRMVTFLRAQKYEKLARFNKVVPTLNHVIKDSEFITVILISSGDGKIQGTPLDDRINEYFDQWRKQHQKARIPFVIVLRATNGQLADYSLNTPPWPLQMPRLVSAMKSAEIARENPPEPAPRTPFPAVPPLIVSKKEPKSEPAPAPKPEPAVGKTEAPTTLDAAAITNEPAKAKPPEPAAPPIEVARAEPPPTMGLATTPDEPVEAKPPEPAASAIEVAKAEQPPTAGATTTPDEPVKAKPPEPAAPPVEVAKAEPPPTVDIAAITNEPVMTKPPEPTAPPVEVAKAEPPPAAPDVPAMDSVPKPAPAPTPVAQPKAEIAQPPEPKPVEPAPVKPEVAPPPPAPTPTPEPVTIEPPKPSPAPQMTTGAASAALAVHEAAPTAATNSTVAQPAPSAPSSLAPRPSSPPTLPVQSATAVPAGTLTSHQSIWIAGVVLAVAAAVSALLLTRRSRAAPQASLITRSFEREKKP
jgi:hypothetical protein